MFSKPPAKSVIHISRHWDNPQIVVKLYVDGIAVEMSVEDFCKALVADSPHPLWALTRWQLEKNLLGTVQGVLEKAKESTIHV